MVEEAVKALQKGKLIIIYDDLKREDEGDFIGIPKLMDVKTFNFMITKARGAFVALFCENGWCEKMNIKQQVNNVDNSETNRTRMMVSIDHRSVKSGSSVEDRLMTCAKFFDDLPENFSTPGHIIPIESVYGGIHERRGHTEAGVEMVKLAGIKPAIAVDMEILNGSGSMANLKELKVFSKKYKIPLVRISEILEYSMKQVRMEYV